MPWLGDVQAVLETWYAGEAMGPALAALLFGDTAPSGKLPMTFPKALGDTPTQTPEQYPGVFADGSTTRPAGSTEIRQVNFTEGLKVGYRWYEAEGIDPLFAFGHGLYIYDVPVQRPPRDTAGRRRPVRGQDHLPAAQHRTAGRHRDRPGLPQAAPVDRRAVATARRLGEGDVGTRGVSDRGEIRLSRDDLDDLRLLQHWDSAKRAWTTETGWYTMRVGGSVDSAVSARFLVAAPR